MSNDEGFPNLPPPPESDWDERGISDSPEYSGGLATAKRAVFWMMITAAVLVVLGVALFVASALLKEHCVIDHIDLRIVDPAANKVLQEGSFAVGPGDYVVKLPSAVPNGTKVVVGAVRSPSGKRIHNVK